MRSGTIIAGKYSMRELIYVDGPNQTWLGETTEKQRRALKFSLMYPRTINQINQQEELYQKIKHQNLIPRHQSFEQVVEGCNYRIIVSDYFQDGDFTKVIALEPGSDQLKLKLLLDIAEGLDYLHSNNILHRNIKPENMFRKGEVGKLGDFELAKLVKKSYARKTTAAGPPLYKSYETYHRDDYDESADVWSFGLVLLEAALRKRLYEVGQWQSPPCQELSQVEKLLKSASKQYPELCKLISGMLLHDAIQRKKMRQVKKELRKIYELKRIAEIKLVTIMVQLTLSNEVHFPILSQAKKKGYEKALNELKGKKSFSTESLIVLGKGRSNIQIMWDPSTDNLTFSGIDRKNRVLTYQLLHPQYRRHFPTNFHLLQEITAKDEHGKQKEMQLKGKTLIFKATVNDNDPSQQDYQPLSKEAKSEDHQNNFSVPSNPRPVIERDNNQVRPELYQPSHDRFTPPANFLGLDNFSMPIGQYQTIDGLSSIIEALWDQQPNDFHRIAQTLLKKARLFSDTKMYGRAVLTCQEAIQALQWGHIYSQTNGLAWQAMGIYNSYSNKYDMALKCLEQSGEIFHSLAPNTIQDLNNLCIIGGVQLAKGDLEMAEYCSRSVMEGLPRMFDYHKPSTIFIKIAAGKLHANVLVGRGKLNEAVIEYSKVMELLQHVNFDFATTMSVRTSIIQCLGKLGQAQKALVELGEGFKTIELYGGKSNPVYYQLSELAIDIISKRISVYGASQELLIQISEFLIRYLPEQEGLAQQIAMKISQF